MQYDKLINRLDDVTTESERIDVIVEIVKVLSTPSITAALVQGSKRIKMSQGDYVLFKELIRMFDEYAVRDLSPYMIGIDEVSYFETGENLRILESETPQTLQLEVILLSRIDPSVLKIVLSRIMNFFF